MKMRLQSIEIRDLNNSLTKTIKCPVQTNDIFYGGTASLLLSTATSIILFDIQQQKTLAELATPPVKYVVWSVDGNSVALLSKHSESPFWRAMALSFANMMMSSDQLSPSPTRPSARARSSTRPSESSLPPGTTAVSSSTPP